MVSWGGVSRGCGTMAPDGAQDDDLHISRPVRARLVVWRSPMRPARAGRLRLVITASFCAERYLLQEEGGDFARPGRRGALDLGKPGRFIHGTAKTCPADAAGREGRGGRGG